VWITGNHDSRMEETVGGDIASELSLGGIVLRHKAAEDEVSPEISGHFHPRLTVRARGKRIARPCAVLGLHGDGRTRLVLPAFGALTGGMDAADPSILSAMQPADRIDALLPAADRLVRYPLWRTAA
jgi:metallophosphoesterase superfamily enzyme